MIWLESNFSYDQLREPVDALLRYQRNIGFRYILKAYACGPGDIRYDISIFEEYNHICGEAILWTYDMGMLEILFKDFETLSLAILSLPSCYTITNEGDFEI